MWQRRRGALRALGVGLAAAHAVPALDHLPRFIGAMSWADGWRGIGASLAVLWFATPLPVQARVIHAIAAFGGVSPWRILRNSGERLST
jgi:hypothetical protein